ncbi:MAG: hypothetical protein RR869_09675, partial [Lachnospiraceae bacterium]
VQGKGKRKSEAQQLYEELDDCGKRLMGLKDDHMTNGQLKPAYNVQIAVVVNIRSGVYINMMQKKTRL